VPEDQSALLREVEKSEADLFNLAVHQVVNVNPNNIDGNGAKHLQRYDRDLLYSSATELFYRWDTNAEEWVAIGDTLYQVVNVNPNDTDGNGTKHPQRYDRDLLYSSNTELFYFWEANAELWVAIGGGGSPVIYGEGDPNHYEGLTDRVPWAEGAIYYDLINQRAFIASPATDVNGNPYTDDSDKFWMPTGAKTASENEPLTMYYPGDFWQDEQIDETDEKGGMLYRLNENGDWDPQYFCGDCDPEDNTPEMCSALTYTTTPGSSDLNWFVIYYDCDNPPPNIPLFGV
jgi:hypothetical protein